MVDDRVESQIVEVLTECRLLDGARREKLYWRRDGSCLAPGFYVVSEPAGVAAGKFYEDSLFQGPFDKRESAEAALRK